MQNLLKHPFRHILQNSVLAVPGAKSLQARRSGSTGANQTENPPAVMLEWADKILANAREHRPQVQDARLVEVGPGHSLGVAMALLLEGARQVTALDVKPFCDLTDTRQFVSLADHWQAMSKGKGALPKLDELISKLKYAILGKDGRWPVESGQTDLVYSFFAGEHLRDPALVLAETSTALRDGGLCMFAIDLRNHLDHAGNWLGHLYYSDRQWEAMTSRRGHWTNRLLAPEWRKLFEDRFDVLEFETRCEPPPPGFSQARLADRFSGHKLEDILIDYIWVVGRKPAAGVKN